MPVLGVNMRKCPADAAQTDTVRYVRVLINVFLVIVINEIVTEGLAENQPGNCQQDQAYATY